ncbi:UPF0016-domain-containing protein [Patellaria atrata CBS 101060]|uniref:UPF0016-domain-containing protein n=1 Tax=Patellaria atrata CBS 101060 TaxID=1346257 RepID=A0A9P4S8N4_9PEZI|nr:UPF0016-domain-containing protein [Patellaria atrata CBS 101060]
MKFRRRHSPLLILLLSTLAISRAIDIEDVADKTSLQQVARDAYPPVATLPALSTTTRSDVGTKDAPVDGQDGKPHAGPWVDGSTEKPTKLSPAVEDLGSDSTERTKPIPLSDFNEMDPDEAKEALRGSPNPDGVMDDLNRETPRKGTTGTEGGVSEKERERKQQEEESGTKIDRIPDPPKEAPPLPLSEQERIGLDDEEDEDEERPKGAVGLEKPADLPDKTHDIPLPVPPTLPNDEEQGTTPSTQKPTSDEEDPSGVIQPFHSFVLSLAMILFSEVGDKTFLVAALMAMRHPRLVVFSAAFSALIAMTVLSAVLGHAVPTLLPKRLTNLAAAILFFVFGAKLLREGLAMSPDEGVGAEMKEVEEELEEKEHLARRNSRRRSSISPYALEAGRGRKSRSHNTGLSAPRSPSSSPSRSPSPNGSSVTNAINGLNNLLSLLLSPAWVQTFIMTFLGEWGDRSQIATIAMAAGQDYWWVTGGAISGHAVCTGVAVLGGRAIAGRVSMRMVTLGGAGAFLIFGLIYLIETMYSE